MQRMRLLKKVDWCSDYLNEVDSEWNYGNFNSQEILALAYLSSLRRQVTDVGLTYLAAFDGRHRSGKSIAATTFGYLWDPTFWPQYESRMVQEPKEFMDALERIDQNKINGAVIQVDEAGVSMANSEWYERWMKTLTKTVQMFGYLHPVVFFVAPIKDFVDSRLRRMFHAYYAVSRYSSENSVIKPYNVSYSTIRNKWYYRKPIVRFGDQRIKLEKIVLGKPPKEIIDRYENYEQGVKSRMLSDFISDMRCEETKQVKQKKDLMSVVAHVCKNYYLFQAKSSKPDKILLDIPLIKYGLDLSTEESRYVKLQAEKQLTEKTKEINDLIQEKDKEDKKNNDRERTKKQAISGSGSFGAGTSSNVFG